MHKGKVFHGKTLPSCKKSVFKQKTHLCLTLAQLRINFALGNKNKCVMKNTECNFGILNSMISSEKSLETLLELVDELDLVLVGAQGVGGDVRFA